MTKVQQHYPDMAITVGLVTKQYYFDIQGDEPQMHTVPEATVVPGTVSPPIIPNTPPAPVVEEPVNEASDSDGEEEATTFPVLNKVKTGAPSASNFRKEIDKLSRYYPEIRAILPMFTNLGVLSKLQIYMMGFCMDCFDRGEDAKDRVYSAVDMLVTKGYLAEFKGNEDTTLYCLSTYSCGCLNKESIKQSQNFFNISIGNVKLSANREVHIGDSLRFYLTNNTLLLYLWRQRENLSAPEYAKIKKSIKWCDDHYQVAFYDEGTIQTAYLGLLIRADDNLDAAELDASDIEAKYIIISKENADGTITFNSTCKKVIVVESAKLYFCDPKKSLIAQMDDSDASNGTIYEEIALDRLGI